MESVENPAAFFSTKCDSYARFLSGECEGNDRVALAGDLTNKDGDYHFLTNAERPYSKENATYTN